MMRTDLTIKPAPSSLSSALSNFAGTQQATSPSPWNISNEESLSTSEVLAQQSTVSGPTEQISSSVPTDRSITVEEESGEDGELSSRPLQPGRKQKNSGVHKAPKSPTRRFVSPSSLSQGTWANIRLSCARLTELSEKAISNRAQFTEEDVEETKFLSRYIFFTVQSLLANTADNHVETIQELKGYSKNQN